MSSQNHTSKISASDDSTVQHLKLDALFTIKGPTATQTQLPSLAMEGLPDKRQVLRHARAALHDWRQWATLPPDEQDLLLALLAFHLLPHYRFVHVQHYHCGSLHYRIACFVHEATGACLHLLPGDAQAQIAPFLMGRTPLPQAAWDTIGGRAYRHYLDPALPIVGVSWSKAADWMRRAGGGLRFPSVEEWQYAAYAGASTRYPWGNHWDHRYVWSYANAGQQLHEVEEHADATNAFGLIDVLGHVTEWCEDELHSEARCSSLQYRRQRRTYPKSRGKHCNGQQHFRQRGHFGQNPTRTQRTRHISYRAVCGAHHNSKRAKDFTSTYSVPSHSRRQSRGFRVACTLPKASASQMLSLFQYHLDTMSTPLFFAEEEFASPHEQNKRDIK